MSQRRSVAGLLLAGLLAVAAPAIPATPGEPPIGFVRPRAGAIVLGPSTLELSVNPPEGAPVDRVEIRVDGRPLAILEAPPWKLPWDAGDGEQGHRIDALLRLQDGRTFSAAMTTRPLVIDEYASVDLVNLYIVVRDPAGRYVKDLREGDFRVLERGTPQKIERFSATRKPLRVGIVLDNSLTMQRGGKLEKAKAAALAFLEVLDPGDEGLVVNFSDTVEFEQKLTQDRELLAAAIQRATPKRGTALYDAIWKTSRSLADFDGRRVLVLLSDGRDESYDGLSPGSLHTLEEAVDEALRSEVMVFTIGLGDNLDKEYAIRWNGLAGRSNLDETRSLESILVQLADSTGGRAVITGNAERLRRAFEQFAEHLRNQYSIAYSSTDPTRDGKWRKLAVEVPGRGFDVVTRNGYYAPRALPDSNGSP